MSISNIRKTEPGEVLWIYHESDSLMRAVGVISWKYHITEVEALELVVGVLEDCL